MSALKLDALVANLGNQVVEHKNELFDYLSLNLEQNLTKIGATIHEDLIHKLVLPNIDTNEIVQTGGNINWAPTVDAIEFDNRTLEVSPFKVDLVIDPFEWHRSYMAYYRKAYANKDITEMPFYEWLPKKIMAQASKDLYKLAYYGDTASLNALLKVANGWVKTIKADVAASKLPTVTLGVITAANVVTKLETIGRSIGVAYRDVPAKLIVPIEVVDWYISADSTTIGRYVGFNDLSGKGVNQAGRMPIFLRGTNIELVAESQLLPNVGGIHPCILVVDGNMAVGTNFMSEYTNMEIEKDKRAFNVMIDGRIGFNYHLASTKHKLMVVNEYFV